jgi:hypothetical protein
MARCLTNIAAGGKQRAHVDAVSASRDPFRAIDLGEKEVRLRF